MTIKELSLRSLVAALVLSSACVVDDDPGQDTDTETNPTTMTDTNPSTETMTDPTVGTSTTNSTDPDTTDTETDTTDPSDTDTDTDTEAGDPDVYDFREDAPDAYVRVDRMGFPAINTALIAAENKDAYNQSNRSNDVTAADTFAADAVATLQFLHGDDEPGSTGLNDDLALANTLFGVSLEACGATLGVDTSCLEQAVPLAFPDVVLLETGEISGFPNGRALEVPVVDIILAAVLIDVSADPDGLLQAFATIGLSQSPNDVAFSGTFPYLGAAHE